MGVILRRFITAVLVLVLMVSTLVGCGANSDDINSDRQESSASSYMSWVGRFKLEKLEVFGNVFVKEDFPDLHYYTNQHITLNKDGTGKLAISCYTTELPLETADIRYTYDMAHKSGYIFTDSSSDGIKFTLSNGVLVFDAIGATWTFKKQD